MMFLFGFLAALLLVALVLGLAYLWFLFTGGGGILPW